MSNYADFLKQGCNLDWSDIWKAIHNHLSRELQARYELPHELAHRMLALLMQLNEHEANTAGGTPDDLSKKRRSKSMLVSIPWPRARWPAGWSCNPQQKSRQHCGTNLLD
jgi:hypothetical protein